MDGFAVVVVRLIALSIVAFWIVWFVIAVRQPPDWRPPRAETFPIRVSRNAFLAGAVLGVIAGFAVLAFSFVFFS
jgi:hypothetical protein